MRRRKLFLFRYALTGIQFPLEFLHIHQPRSIIPSLKPTARRMNVEAEKALEISMNKLRCVNVFPRLCGDGWKETIHTFVCSLHITELLQTSALKSQQTCRSLYLKGEFWDVVLSDKNLLFPFTFTWGRKILPVILFCEHAWTLLIRLICHLWQERNSKWKHRFVVFKDSVTIWTQV